MIQNCANLRECERTLAPLVPTITLLGQIPLTDETYGHLTELIRTKLTWDLSRGTAYLNRWAPISFACFLVWTGIVGYRNGNYWSAVHEAVGEIDANWQSQWGQFFLCFLQKHHLPQFAIEGCPPYVTPILLHGLLPNACLDTYFTHIVRPLAQCWRLVEPPQVRHELQIYRTDDERRQALERERTQGQQQQQTLDKQIRQNLTLAQEYDTIHRLWELEAQGSNWTTVAPSPQPVVVQQSPDTTELPELTAQIQRLASEQAECTAVLTSFTELDQRLLAHESRIVEAAAYKAKMAESQTKLARLADREAALQQAFTHHWQQLSARPWDESYGDLLCQLPLERLALAEVECAARAKDLQAVRQEHLLLQQTRTRWRQRWLMIVGLLGFTLLLWRVEGFSIAAPSDPPLLAVTGFVIMSGLLIESWRMQGLRRRQKLQVLKQAVQTAEAAYQRAQQQVTSLWGNVPGGQEAWSLEGSALIQSYRELADKYSQLRALRQQQDQLQDTLKQWQQQIDEVVNVVVITGVDAQDIFETLSQALTAAHSRYIAAQQARKRLDGELIPTLTALQAKQQLLRLHMTQSPEEFPLRRDGNTTHDPAPIELMRQPQAEARSLRTQLEARYPSFAKAERFLRNSGKDKAMLREAAEQSYQQLKAVTNRLEAIERELTYRPAAFAALDEPIRRFLLYGGEPAEDFLVDSIALLQQAGVAGHFVPPDHNRLPQRVLTAFAAWWMNQSSAESAPSDNTSLLPTEQFRTPVVLLAPGLAEVVLQLPVQRWPDTGLTADLSFVVTTPELPTTVEKVALRTYRSVAGMVETAPLTQILPFPADLYHAALMQGEQERQHWTIALHQPNMPYIAFDWQSKKLLRSAELPSGKVWLLLPKRAVVEPADCLLQQAALHGRWDAYHLCGVDLTTVDELSIVHDNQTMHFYPEQSATRVKLELVGSQPSPTMQSAGVVVYVGAPPRLRLPLSDAAELTAWRISFGATADEAGNEHKVYRLSELHQAMALTPAEGWAELPLADGRLLGPTAAGSFVLRVWKPPYTEREFHFVVIPWLAFAFDQPLYFPHRPEQKASVARLELKLGSETTFLPKAPAHLGQTRQSFCVINIPITEDAIHGVLQVQRQGKTNSSLLLSFPIPKVVWRLEGLAEQEENRWYDTLAEVWFGDWERAAALFLLVKVPPSVNGQLALTLEHQAGQQQATLRDGSVRFDLLALRDALAQGPAVQVLQLSHLPPDTRFEHMPLLRVRTRWEAEEIECIQRIQGRIITLSVSWLDRGKAEGKRLYVWSMGSHSQPLIACDVAGEAQQVEVKASATSLPPGAYLLQIVAIDPWATTDPVRPRQTDLNTRRLEIVNAGSLWQGEIFAITTVVDDQGQTHHPKLPYQIKVEGKIINRALPSTVRTSHVLVTHANEGWYVGRLLRPAGEADHQIDRTLWDELLASNPFKFEYNATKGVVTAIEDCYGEGAMYCPTCGKLYWRQETIDAEARTGHPLVGPIELFHIDWKS